jgi:hypothetical protein
MSGSFPRNRGSSTCPWYTVGRNRSDKNLEQREISRFCVKIGKSASETLAFEQQLMVNALWRNRVFLNGIGGSRKGEKVCKMTQEVGSQKRKGQMQMWTEYE